MVKTLGDIRIGVIDNALKNFESLVENRLNQLNKYSENKNFDYLIQEAVNITLKCHSIAKGYLEKEEELLMFMKLPNIDKVDRIIEKHKLNTNKLINREYVVDINNQAYEFIRSVFGIEELDPDGTLGEELEKKFLGDKNIRSIRTVVSSLILHLKQQKETIEISIFAIQLSKIYRGMMYAGIIDYFGDTLKRKEKYDRLKDFGIEALLSFAPPGSGLLLKLKPLFESWFDLESPPPEVKAANQIINYIETYINIMNLWQEETRNIDEFLDTCIQILKT